MTAKSSDEFMDGYVLVDRFAASRLYQPHPLNRSDLANRFGLVFVMDRGQLVERGSFDELMAKGGMLRNLLKPG